jgi:hypothetical protein
VIGAHHGHHRTTISEQEYRDLILSDEDRFWELWDGVPVKLPMSAMHDDSASYLGFLLQSQLDRGAFRVNVQSAKLTVYRQRGDPEIMDI